MTADRKSTSMTRIVKKFADRKAEIIQAARQLFQTKEYDKTTMQDIIRVLDIAKGTLYHYFKSKEQLLEAVVETIIADTTAQMRALIQKSKGNALEKLKILISAGNMATDDPEILDQLHKPGNAIMHSRLLAVAIMQQAPLYAQLIEQGSKEKLFKSDTPLECAEFILSAIQFLTDRGFYPWSNEDLHRRIQAFPRLIEQQLSAPTGSFQFLSDHLKK